MSIIDSDVPNLLDKESSILAPQGLAHKARATLTTRPDTFSTEPSRIIRVRLPDHFERASLHADLDMPDAQDTSNNKEKCKSCKEIFKDSDEFSLHVTLK